MPGHLFVVALVTFAPAFAGCAALPAEEPVDSSAGGSAAVDRQPFVARAERDYGGSGADEVELHVPEDLGPAKLSLAFRPRDGTSACVGVAARIHVTPPTGEGWVHGSDLEVAANGDSCSVRHLSVAEPVPGVWRVAFEGHGSLVGSVTLEAAYSM